MSTKTTFQDDKYLQPVLEDDALLFCLDDLIDAEGFEPAETSPQDSARRVDELQEQLAALQSQFTDYRATVEKTLDERWTANDDSATSNDQRNKPDPEKEIDDSYFNSYSYNGP